MGTVRKVFPVRKENAVFFRNNFQKIYFWNPDIYLRRPRKIFPVKKMAAKKKKKKR